MTHSWTLLDDIKAFYVYKFGIKYIHIDTQKIALMIGFKDDSSFKMRISNFKAIDTGKGLGNFAKQSLNVYKKYKNFDEFQLRHEAFPGLDI